MPLPNPFPWMESIVAKMIRTHEHLEMLAREVDEYLGTIRLQMYLKGVPPDPPLGWWCTAPAVPIPQTPAQRFLSARASDDQALPFASSDRCNPGATLEQLRLDRNAWLAPPLSSTTVQANVLVMAA